MRNRGGWLVPLISISLIFSVSGDEIILKNGDRLTGKIGQVTKSVINVNSPILGPLKVPLDQVESYHTAAPATVQLKSGQRFSATIVNGNKQEVTTANNQTTPVSAIHYINPPPEVWTGNLVFNGFITRGNSNNTGLGLSGLAELRRDNPKINDRTTVGFDYNYAQSKKPGGVEQTTVDNFDARAKYDRYFSDLLYGYANVLFLHDRIAKLNILLAPGAGLGYQWIQSSSFNFRTEAGMSYLYRNFTDGTDDDKATVRLAYHLDKSINGKVSIFSNLAYLVAVEDTNDWFINGDLGMQVSLLGDSFSQVKLVFRHDNQPPPGAKQDDVSLLFGLGAKF